MTKAEFLRTLQEYLSQVNGLDTPKILSCFEAYFATGYEQGANDEEIIATLGNPKEIYEECKLEGGFLFIRSHHRLLAS